MPSKFLTGWGTYFSDVKLIIGWPTDTPTELPLLSWNITYGLREFAGSVTVPANYTGFESKAYGRIVLPWGEYGIYITNITRTTEYTSFHFIHETDYRLKQDAHLGRNASSGTDLPSILMYLVGVIAYFEDGVSISNYALAYLKNYLYHQSLSNTRSILDTVASLIGSTWKVCYKQYVDPYATEPPPETCPGDVVFYKYDDPPIIRGGTVYADVVADDAFIRQLTSKPTEYYRKIRLVPQTNNGTVYEVTIDTAGQTNLTVETPWNLPLTGIASSAIQEYGKFLNMQYYSKTLTFLGISSAYWNALDRVIADNRNNEYLYVYKVEMKCENAQVSTTLHTVRTGAIA